MTRSIHVRAPCRLHFGMFSFGHFDQAQFGGVGVMVDRPAVEVEIAPSTRFAALGPHSDRIVQFTESVVRNWRLDSLPACEIGVRSPPDHVGLGVGTQLGLAVAAGLRRFVNRPDLPIEELALSIGRGMRSAVGTYGFQRGGLIVDAGKEAGQPIGTLVRRVGLPATWRFVLVCSADRRGIAGDCEADAFTRLPPVPHEVTRELWRITDHEMLPAIELLDCAGFGDAVYRFGRFAGECFAAVQGGPFAMPEIARLVEAIRDHGVPGVGQSSWGPTVYAITDNDGEAQSLAEWLRDRLGIAEREIAIARPNNSGAQVSTA